MNAILLNSHILGAGFSLAVAVFAAVFLIHKPFSKERFDIARTFIKATAVAIIWLIVTGAGLFTERPQNSASTILFWVKIGLSILDIILAFALVNRKLKNIGSEKTEKVVKPAPLLAWTIVNIIIIIAITALSLNISK